MESVKLQGLETYQVSKPNKPQKTKNANRLTLVRRLTLNGQHEVLAVYGHSFVSLRDTQTDLTNNSASYSYKSKFGKDDLGGRAKIIKAKSSLRHQGKRST